MTTPLVNEKFQCYVCARELPVNHSGGTGYARLGDQKVCYDCVARMDAAEMLKGEPIVLYITPLENSFGRSFRISNWPETLAFIGQGHASWHNMAGKGGRTDVWFYGPDGARWHGVNIGDNQICRCHRLKKQKKDIEPMKESAYLKPYPYDR